jgi:radical SAM-linked protein
MEPTTFPSPLRIAFSKGGRLIYISHLDLNRLFERAFVRAEIPAWYTEGFNPRLKIVFASPISVGVRGLKEFFDIKITQEISSVEVKNALNAQMPEGLEITDVYTPETKFSSIYYSEYRIEFTGEFAENDGELISEIFSDNVTATKPERPKSGKKKAPSEPKTVDVSALTDFAFGIVSGGKLIVSAILENNSKNYLSSDFFATVLRERLAEKQCGKITAVEIYRTRHLTKEKTEFV